jgi:hypothetical protein
MNTLADASKWRSLEVKFPGISGAFQRLAETVEKTVNREVAAEHPLIAVYSTGILACEDFAEIAFLAENDYGFAALKLLRGMYERVVVGRYIALNQDEAQNFYDYWVIDWHKFSTRANTVYGSGWQKEPPTRVKESYEQMKKKFKYDPCPQCGRPTQDSFSKHSLPALARSLQIGELMRRHDGKIKQVTGEDAYLLCAALPNTHIHASMWSFFQRVTSEDNPLWNPDQEPQVEFALSVAHGLMPVVLETQSLFFKLGLEDEIKERRRDWHGVWNPRNQAPISE